MWPRLAIQDPYHGSALFVKMPIRTPKGGRSIRGRHKRRCAPQPLQPQNLQPIAALDRETCFAATRRNLAENVFNFLISYCGRLSAYLIGHGVLPLSPSSGTCLVRLDHQLLQNGGHQPERGIQRRSRRLTIKICQDVQQSCLDMLRD